MRPVILTTCLLTASCAATSPPAPRTSAQSPAVEIVARSDHCRINKPAARLLEDATDAAGIVGKPVEAGTDSDGDVLVLIALGTQPTPGYGVTLTRSRQAPVNGTLDVPIDYTEPAPDAILPQVLTSPCAVMAVRRISGVRVLAVPLYGGDEQLIRVGPK